MNSNPSVGTLSIPPLRSTGRRIDSWTFTSGIKGELPLEFPVFLRQVEKDMVFVAVNDALKPAELHSANLNELKVLVTEAAQQHFMSKHGLQWESWLKVTVEGNSFENPRDGVVTFSLSVSYSRLPRAVLPDGTAVTANHLGRVVAFPKPNRSSDSALREGTKRIKLDDSDDGSEVSYIRETPEAVAALEAVQANMDKLRVSLSGLLRQDVIEQHLPSLQRLALGVTNRQPD